MMVSGSDKVPAAVVVKEDWPGDKKTVDDLV
jgi:hypothetical protein